MKKVRHFLQICGAGLLLCLCLESVGCKKEESAPVPDPDAVKRELKGILQNLQKEQQNK